MNKFPCPKCGRVLSENLIRFPIFFDDKDETMVYNICPLCALGDKNKAEKLPKNTPFKREHSQKLYDEALKETEDTKQQKKKGPIPQNEIRWVKLVKLTPEEYEKVTKKHPELLN